MRVTHIITRLIVGGAQENTVASVLGLMAKPGVTVDLISGPTNSGEGTLENAFANIPGTLQIARQLEREVDPLTDLRALVELTRMLRERRPDIVHTHSSKAGILGRLAARRAGVPVVAHTIHGPSFGGFQGPVSNAVFKTAERVAARWTTHFVSVADAMTAQFLDAGIGRPEQFSTIRSGFPLEPFLEARNDPALRVELGLKADAFVVGKIARLFERKGHDDLIEMASELVRQCPKIQFLLVGGGPWRERLEARVRSAGLGEQFVFTGLVPPGDVPRYVGVMDALVHLSCREGLARALPQALAAARPVVAYDYDGAREVCLDGRTGRLVPAGNRAEAVRAISELAADVELRRRLGEAGREFVRERFTAGRMVDELHALYAQLLRRQKASR